MNFLIPINFHNNKIIKKNKIKYSLKFASIITPGTIKNLSLLNSNQKHNSNKLIIKQSYILLIWLMYLQGSYSELNDNQKIPSFFIHKKLQTKTTKLKTPMAHKTFSQEQFIFKFYTLSISFKTDVTNSILPNSVNNSIYTVLYLRNSLPFFNTNLLFLKNFKFTFKSSDQNFMLLK